jgi:hypothetical protein
MTAPSSSARTTPTPKQREFFNVCNERESEDPFRRAVRSGEDAGRLRLISAWAWHFGGPNWKFAILRKTYRELADSTQAAFWKGDGKMPPACPPELVRRVLGKDETVILHNGSQILFRSAENAHEAEERSEHHPGRVFIDQVEEF